MIITVFSPKGGVGKTTLTLALAKVLSEDKKVCAVEVDFSPGDFVSLLDLEKEKNIVNACLGDYKACLQRPTGEKFDVIVGGFPDMQENLKYSDMEELIDSLSGEYDYVLIDLQPQISEVSVPPLLKADKVLFVLEDDISAVSRTVGILEYLKLHGFLDTSRACAVVNKAKGKKKYITAVDLGIPVIYDIPYIRKLNEYKNKKMIKHAKNLKDALFEVKKEKSLLRRLLNGFKRVKQKDK
ncbi:AAA family ATPase [Thermoanaerobacter wiegelii]|uniref:Chromosome partitioning ATPase n=1 Tax=Thermoanaerobacter wiegelii Rt8.B1 TaxID=697303 RepID=G2MRM0_9THEO|nr:AAA family ATPase [Thermoanaerobacter wiegelii]AEM79751.1 chromosome partitioning ATPase [Thermoanaerobacter wiegelii Rt8.B1]